MKIEMSRELITELFTRAAEIDAKLPDTARPAQLKAMNLGFIHTRAEMNGWFSEDKHAANWAWLDPRNLRTTTNDIGLWEVSMELMKLVRNIDQRRALWAWARSEAKCLCLDNTRKRIPFRRWCIDVEGILPATGNWRRNAAISSIELTFASKGLQHNDFAHEPDFTNHPENDDKRGMIRADRIKQPSRDDIDYGLTEFNWAAAQNARRREREKKRKAA